MSRHMPTFVISRVDGPCRTPLLQGWAYKRDAKIAFTAVKKAHKGEYIILEF